MVERVRLNPKKQRAKANHRYFTEANVLTFKPKRVKQYLIWDAWTEERKRGPNPSRGLAILVSPSGAKSYRVVYYFPGDPKPHYKHLGTVGGITLAEARELATQARTMSTRGDDPKADDVSRSDNFESAVKDYIKHEQIGRHGNKSAEKTERVLINNCTLWLKRPVATIRYREIEKLLWQVRDGDNKDLKPRPYLANRLFSHLKGFFGWCARRKVINASPMIDMERPWEGAKSRDREWFKKTAADTAIKSFWSAAEKIGGSEGRYLKLMILTGKRKTALANMRWEEIDNDWFWDAPPSDTKNKRLHGVPLSSLAQRILHPRKSHGSVFDAMNFDKLQRKVRKESGISDFFYHGVRHMAETKNAELRDGNDRSIILPHIRDLLFDHATQRGSGKGYDHHDYKPEMRTAAEAWAEYVEGVVYGKGVKAVR